MSWFRALSFGLKGYCDFTRPAFLKAKKSFKPLQEDLSGKVVIITGGNSGIGYEAAIILAKMGAEVHIACRSPDRGQKALEEIISKSQSSQENVKLHILDVSKSDTVHTFVSDFTKQLNGKKLYALVNNAGCMVERAENAFGYEINFATNTLGMYILTKGFIEEKALGDGSRVVTVTSGGMLSQPLELDDMQWKKAGFDATKAYAKHKRQQVVITDVWAKKYPSIQFLTTHPGWADTPALRGAMPDFHEKMKDKLRTAEEGADCIVHGVASKTADLGQNGSFYTDRKPASKHLTLAFTQESSADAKRLEELLDEMYEKTKTPNT